MSLFKQFFDFNVLSFKIIFLLIFNIYFQVSNGQDTLFVRSLPTKSVVHNITSDGQQLYLRIGDSIYRREKGKLVFISKGHLRYSWITHDNINNSSFWSHNSLLLEPQVTPQNKIKNILPGPYNSLVTSVRLKNILYVCYNGNVLEYRINNLVKLAYPGSSIRHVFSEDGLRIISTYSGVFGGLFDDFFTFSSDKLENYSNGKFERIGEHYFLCQDALLSFNKETASFEQFMMFPQGQEVRQLIDFNGATVGVFTNGLYIIDIEKKAIIKTLVNDAISRAEKIGNELIAVTREGTVYRISKLYEIETIKTGYSFNDLEAIDGTIFLGGDLSLYTLQDNKVSIVTNFEVIEMINYKDNLIFSNNDGLYTWLNASIIPIYTGVEFNKLSLGFDNALFYAGSVNGLYYMSIFELDAWLNDKKEINQLKNNKISYNPFYFVSIGLLFITFFFGLVLWKKYKIKKSIVEQRFIETQLSETYLKEIIMSKKNILSVSDLAEELKTSTVQLNRKLARSNISALNILKETKKEIALEMYKNGNSISSISKRVGYSERFIKENFLK